MGVPFRWRWVGTSVALVEDLTDRLAKPVHLGLVGFGVFGARLDAC